MNDGTEVMVLAFDRYRRSRRQENKLLLRTYERNPFTLFVSGHDV